MPGAEDAREPRWFIGKGGAALKALGMVVSVHETTVFSSTTRTASSSAARAVANTAGRGSVT
jgi:hypothetical protein